MDAFVHRYISNEKIEKEFASVLDWAAKEGSPDVRNTAEEMARVFVQDRITCKCGCYLYRVAYNCRQYVITPAYLILLAEKGKLKNREYEIKTSKAGRKYVDVKYMKHIKSNWTFAQFDGREAIDDFAFLQ